MVGNHRYYVFPLLILALYIGAGFLFALAERETGNVNYEIFRMKALHAEEAESPARVLLVGGSNVNWGHRSQVIEDELRISTTNLALNREGGDPKVMRELALSVAKENDIVVYSSVIFWNQINLDPEPAADLLKAAGLSLSESPWEDFKAAFSWYWRPFPVDHMLLYELPRIYKRYVAEEPSVHFAKYNKHGDNRSCSPTVVRPKSFGQGPDLSLIDRLKIFRDELSELNVHLVIEFSWMFIFEEDRERWISEFQPLFEILKHEFTVANDNLNEVLKSDGTLFCDTENHLAEEAAAIRSRNLANFLKYFMEGYFESLGSD